jgi:two-component system NarL family sensor kinase
MSEDNFSSDPGSHRLTAAEQRAGRILDTIQDACFELNRQGHLVFVNPKAEELLGQKKERLLGRSVWEVFPEPAASPFYEALQKALEHQVPSSNEYVSAALNKWVFLSTTPSPEGVIVLFHEIMEMEEMRQKLRVEHLRLKDAQAIGHIGSFERSYPEDQVYWSDELYRLHGLEPQSGEMTPEKFMSFVHPEDLPELEKALRHTWESGNPMDIVQRIVLPDGSIRHVHRRAQVRYDEQGKVLKITGTIQDITDQVKAEQEIKEKNALLQAVLNAPNLGVTVYKSVRDDTGQIVDFEYLLVSNKGLETTRRPDLVGKRLFEEFPSIQEKCEAFRKVVETGVTYTYETHITDGGLDNCIFTSTAKFGDGLVVVWEDTTERRKAEAEMLKRTAQWKTLVENIPDIIIYYDTELRLMDANTTLTKVTGRSLDDLKGKTFEQIFGPGADISAMAGPMHRTLEKGLSQFGHVHFSTPAGDIDLDISHSPYFDGAENIIGICAIARDVTAAKRNEYRLKASLDLLQSVYNASTNSISVFKSVRNRKGDIVDFEWLLADKQTENYAGGQDVKGKRFSEVFPGIIKTGTLQKCIQVVEKTGKADFEQLYQADGVNAWFRNVLVRTGDGLVLTSEDITERKQAEIGLKESNELLETIFNTTPFALMVAKSQRNKKGRITDFVFTWANTIAEKIGGGPLTTQSLRTRFPHVKNNGLFQLLAEAVETGKTVDIDYNYTDGRLKGWYRWIGARLADGLFCILENVTERRRQETEIRKNLAILHQAEELAGMGSWEYQPGDKTFLWSGGMYRLFGLAPGSPVMPHIYLEVAIAEDQPIARRMVKNISRGYPSFTETLRIQNKEAIQTLKIKATAIPEQAGQAAKIVGVDLDVSEVQRLEKENMDIKLNQQKALLLAILKAQEEERRRIAESLHNGLAQLLYATRLQLDQIKDPGLGPSPSDMQKAKDRAQQLLAEAIHQTRQISHELIPTVLEDFGLEMAVQDICKKFHSSGIHFQCRVARLKNPLDKYLQLAIYRICQELVNNIVKHSGARQASIQVCQVDKCLAILVEDNGQGFQPQQAHTQGVGLNTIQDQVKLLNGTLEIDSNPQQGTLISIYLPQAEAPGTIT